MPQKKTGLGEPSGLPVYSSAKIQFQLCEYKRDSCESSAKTALKCVCFFFSLSLSLQLLRNKFREFARETGMVGQERVDLVNLTIDELIEAGHSEAAAMAEWKDGINESWADLLELIDTRTQLLTTSYELLK